MGKTITTYLVDGNPQGVQEVFISNKICKMLVIPRARLSIINDRPELLNPAFYILLGEDENQRPKAYLGETENFRERIKNHDTNKPFWQKAYVFISKDGAMTKADVQYLEHLSLATAEKARRFSLEENKQTPKAPNLPEHQKDSIDEFFLDVRLLTSFIGCNIFDIIEQKNKHLFFTKYRKCNAKGFYDENGFTVLKGSLLAQYTVPSFSWKEERAKILKEFAIVKDGNFILNIDRTFSSPSTAADFCIGSSNNGWLTWKDKDGQTLDTVYRKKLDE